MSEYNKRQFHRISTAIEDFESGAINLRRFIATIEGLNAALEKPGEVWDKVFHEVHLRLEQVSARVVVEGQAAPSMEEHSIVAKALSDLKGALEAVDVGASR